MKLSGVIVGKINMLSYQMSPSIPENISYHGISLLLKYLPTIKINLSIFILAYPKWSVLPTVIFTTDATSICGYPCTLTHTLSLSVSLSVSPLSCTLAPSFLFQINMMTVHVFDY